MALACNIDAKGKLARLIYGAVLVFIAIAVAGLAWRDASTALWIIAVIAFLSGAFAIFEGWAGWCVVRAMGFKTRM
jgi:hypothetical protein